MKRHGRKKRHPRGDRAPDMLNHNDWMLKEDINQSYNEETRKHKKKGKDEKLTLWEGLILLLLLIENGIFDEFFKTDEFKEVDDDEYEELNIKSKHKSNKGKGFNSKENCTKESSKKDEKGYHEEGKENYTEKYSDDNGHNGNETDDSEIPDGNPGNKKSHFDFDYFSED